MSPPAVPHLLFWDWTQGHVLLKQTNQKVKEKKASKKERALVFFAFFCSKQFFRLRSLFSVSGWYNEPHISTTLGNRAQTKHTKFKKDWSNNISLISNRYGVQSRLAVSAIM